MSLLNPFNEKGREDTSFVDRTAIAILWLIMMITAILLPVIVYRWYISAGVKARRGFWLLLLLCAILGLWFDCWING